jgi:hypothetical protein
MHPLFTHSLTHSLTPLRAHLLIHPLAHSLTHSPTLPPLTLAHVCTGEGAVGSGLLDHRHGQRGQGVRTRARVLRRHRRVSIPLPHYLTTTLPHYSTTSLLHYITTSLIHYYITTPLRLLALALACD